MNKMIALKVAAMVALFCGASGAAIALMLGYAELITVNDHVSWQLKNFKLNHQRYIEAVRSAPRATEPLLLVFETGGQFALSSGVVYDESDQISLPKDLQSASWIKQASQSELGCGYSSRWVESHFYIADFAC